MVHAVADERDLLSHEGRRRRAIGHERANTQPCDAVQIATEFEATCFTVLCRYLGPVDHAFPTVFFSQHKRPLERAQKVDAPLESKARDTQVRLVEVGDNHKIADLDFSAHVQWQRNALDLRSIVPLPLQLQAILPWVQIRSEEQVCRLLATVRRRLTIRKEEVRSPLRKAASDWALAGRVCQSAPRSHVAVARRVVCGRRVGRHLRPQDSILERSGDGPVLPLPRPAHAPRYFPLPAVLYRIREHAQRLEAHFRRLLHVHDPCHGMRRHAHVGDALRQREVIPTRAHVQEQRSRFGVHRRRYRWPSKIGPAPGSLRRPGLGVPEGKRAGLDRIDG
mmetsp:Transcript_75831/g.216207  ORF Transcript_75831/g.216207 Transcript_75831/m.216207 type:complete len:336 (+) Transcript_75831:1280-2287(+)